MSELDDCRNQLAKLKERLKNTRDQLKREADQKLQRKLKSKIKAYQEAIETVQAQLDYLDPPKQRLARKTRSRCLKIDALPFDFFERCLDGGFANLDGSASTLLSSADVADPMTEIGQLRQWMEEGSEKLTKRQKAFMDLYYNEGLTYEEIAQRFGINTSVVARVVNAGLDRLKEWVDSKRLVALCMVGRDEFDWVLFLSRTSTLTDRQRELMLIMLSEYPETYSELAEKLEINRSTVWYTIRRAIRMAKRLDAHGTPTRRPAIQDWSSADKFTLAVQTGMPLYFYYRYCFRGQKINGLTRYMYEIAKRRASGKTAEETAKEFGLKVKTVRGIYSRLSVKDAIQKTIYRLEPDDTIASKIDPETYVKLQRLVNGYADS